MRSKLVAISLLVATAALAASARATTYSYLPIRYKRTLQLFKGFVAQNEQECNVGREVVIHKQGHGNVGSTLSDSDSKWRIRLPGEYGKFFATVKKVTLDDGDTCLSDKSVTLLIRRHPH